MNKITLTKRQAVALEKALENLFTKETVLKTHASIELKEKEKWKGSKYEYLNELTLEEMAIALYRGYEVEETKEEKVLSLTKTHFDDKFCGYWYIRGITDTLNGLEIKIKGINE